MNTIKCAYPVSPVGKGVSDAWKIMGDDGRHHLVKFRTEGDHTVLNEMLCGHLAERFGLPSLEPVLVMVDAGPAKRINEARETAGLAPTEPGVHFGVKFTEPFFTVKSPVDAGITLPTRMMDNLGDVPNILGFDTMVRNNDRHCEIVAIEPNTLGGGYLCRIFDFGHAIGDAEWMADTLKETYGALAPIREFCLITEGTTSPGGFERFLRAFESRLEGWLDEFLAVLPPELSSDARADAEVLKPVLAALERDALGRAILGAPALR